MNKLKNRIANFIVEILQEETSFDIYFKCGNKIVSRVSRKFVPRLGDKIKLVDFAGNHSLFEVLDVVSEQIGGVAYCYGHIINNNRSRPDLAYIKQTDFSNPKKTFFAIEKTAIDYDAISPKKDKMLISDRYEKAIANIPNLIQIAESYHDSMVGNSENSFDFQFVSKVLNDLKDAEQ